MRQVFVGLKNRSAIGQRQEILILLPLALLLLAVVSTFALFAYRSTMTLLLESRESEARRLGRQLAAELSTGPLPDPETLRLKIPVASAVTVLDTEGQVLVGTGARTVHPIAFSGLKTWVFGVGSAGEDRVSASVPFHRRGEALTLLVDLPAPILRSRERGLKVLTPVALAINGAITIWVLFYLRRFLAPIDRLVERARHVGQIPESKDEVFFLVETFERALEALARRDVDELKALEGTLGQSFESGVLLCDPAGHVLALNDIGASLLGIGSVAVGAPLGVVLVQQEELSALLESAVRHGETVQREECSVTTPDGERTVGVTAHLLRREDQSIRGFLILFADLTRTKAELQEKHLVESLAQIGELSAGVAHELRNSLATQRGYLSLIEKNPQGEGVSEYLAEIRHESDHLQRVLEDFLSFARPGSVRAQEIDVAALAHRAANDPSLGEAAVRVDIQKKSTDTTETIVLGDPQLLERALRNLLSNAVEAQKEIGRTEPVLIQVSADDRGVLLTVDDHGPGVAKEARDKLFDPFFSRRSGGVGMGLALTRRIVLLHSGRIEIINRAEGGARATVWIPSGRSATDRNKSC